MVFFDPITNIQSGDRLLLFRRNFIICPEQWETLNGLYINFNWQTIKFEDANKDILSEIEGIYMFVASPEKINAFFVNYLFYIGETNNLNRRFNEYLSKIDNPKARRYKVKKVIEKYPNHLFFHYVEIPDYNKSQRKAIEDQFLVGFLPPANTKYPQGIQSIVSGIYAQ